MNSSNSTREIKFTFKDGKCPTVLADAQSVMVWVADGVAHVQFYATQITSPQQLQTHTADVSPVMQVAMSLPGFAALQDAVNNQMAQLEKQGLFKRVAPGTASPDTGAKH